ncbi:hypothetical protein E4U41_002077 [Claviceps citrina]|nr:hypothetical protein E4U41_002077 [Claviceps citrina]
MGHRGYGKPSAPKVHPFFTKGHPSGLAAASPGQPWVLDSVRDSTQMPAAKRHKSDHLSSQRVDAEASDPGQAHDASAASCTQSDADDHCVTGQMVQRSTLDPTEFQASPATPEISTLSGALRSVESDGSTREPAPLAKDPKTTGPSSGRKVLKFNIKTGTFESSPRMKQKIKPSRVVCVRYGKNEVNRREMGVKITQILNGNLRLPMISLKPRPICKKAEDGNRSATSAASSKTTHPFFTGKPRPPRSSSPSQSTDMITTKSPIKKHSVFTSTPMSPRKPKNPFLSVIQDKKAPQPGVYSGGTRIPGAKYPIWPPKGMSHVRGDDCLPLSTASQKLRPIGNRKSKGQVTTIGQTESVLTAIMERIDVKALRGSLPRDEDSFTPAPPELRIPQRHFESGLKLQHRIRPQLSISSPLTLAGGEDVNQDELAGPAPAAAHPAISRHYVSLAKQLSAFDRSTCESVAWSQKYAPVSAAQVLQKGKDAFHIKHWLEAMKVQSVETGSNDGAGDKSRVKADVMPKKRRKKIKVDDFIVDTEDEASDLEEICEEGDEEEDSDAAFWQAKKSVMRSAASTKPRDGAKLKNTIVLSGPHGCGKTAAVYAVAKEVDFEVFEINSSSRRSGKDVLERIGDMTRNHLVQPNRAQAAPIADGDATNATATADESRPSRQGVMTAFFKTKAARKEKKGEKGANQHKKSARPKTQKQSLILVEEADILYEEDKQLWTTLLGMISQSKRPFVITCNDESLIPLESLHLHGIFRFAPAPTPSAVDLCILIAANEGHALRRGAVEALYQSRNFDLRATICDLNFWCQIAVGDRKGGFDWFYSRWPKGCDVDERGHVVRVISQDTYRHGMGWLGRDAVLSERSGLDREMEVLQQSWNFWQVDMGDWSRSAEMSALCKDMGRAARASGDVGAAALEALDDFYRTQSDADLVSCGVFADRLREKMDPSLPKMTTRARDDFTMGRSLLDVQELSHHTRDSLSMSLALKCAARKRLFWASQKRLRRPDRATQHCPLDERLAIAKLDGSFGNADQDMTRMDIARAFDPIAVAPRAQATSHLEPSVFDRTMGLIVVDVAPWVRGIVASEHQLMRERQKLNGLVVGDGGGTRKRMRNTRSAYSALGGGERRSTRRERHFGDALTTSLVARTGGGAAWRDAVAEWMRDRRTDHDGQDGRRHDMK